MINPTEEHEAILNLQNPINDSYLGDDDEKIIAMEQKFQTLKDKMQKLKTKKQQKKESLKQSKMSDQVNNSVSLPAS